MVYDSPVRYFFSWFWEIYNISEDEILRTVGLDALVGNRSPVF